MDHDHRGSGVGGVDGDGAREVAVHLGSAGARERQILAEDARRVADRAGDSLGTGLDLCVRHVASFSLWLCAWLCTCSRGGEQRIALQLTDLALDALARLAELVLELGELQRAVAHQLQLALEVAERLVQELAATLRVDVLAL